MLQQSCWNPTADLTRNPMSSRRDYTFMWSSVCLHTDFVSNMQEFSHIDKLTALVTVLWKYTVYTVAAQTVETPLTTVWMF